MFKLTLVKYFI